MALVPIPNQSLDYHMTSARSGNVATCRRVGNSACDVAAPLAGRSYVSCLSHGLDVDEWSPEHLRDASHLP